MSCVKSKSQYTSLKKFHRFFINHLTVNYQDFIEEILFDSSFDDICSKKCFLKQNLFHKRFYISNYLFDIFRKYDADK